MTIREIINAAYAKSKKNQPGRIATETVELLNVGNRIMRTLFMIGARLNPTYFGASAAVAHDGTGWPRPAAAESIFRIKKADLSEVAVVPFDQVAAESGMPSVYRWGQKFYDAGAATLGTGSLTFEYSKIPTDAANIDATVDALFPSSYQELANLEMAMYLALKDEREAEIAVLRGERDAWLRLFLAHLEHETANERRSYGHVVPFNTGSMVPLFSLLTGGTEVQVP